MTALPFNVPPNRLIQQAILEWWKENDEVQIYSQEMIVTSPPVRQHIVIDVPRYSWSTLGRMLLRACKEGSLYNRTTSLLDEEKSLSLILSPNIQIKLSPLLALPTYILAKIVSYLPTNQLWRLDATCRAISASMISARVILENNTKSVQLHTSIPSLSTNETALDPTAPNESPIEAVTTIKLTHQTSDEAISDDAGRGSEQQMKRKSKRVRSQMLTSGKRNERMHRRNSTDYCFLSSILGCTIDDPIYVQSIQSYQPKWMVNDNCTNNMNDIMTTDIMTHPKTVSFSNDEDPMDQLNESSLYNFICQISTFQICPLSCMFRFIAHASIYTKHVFTNDVGLFDMHSHILDCTYNVRFFENSFIFNEF
jgi:hypothetical protein